jgi:perosamine synthetase
MTGFDTEAILRAFRNVLPADKGRIGLHEPCFAGNEWSYVKDCLDTGWVSSVGSYVDRFERELAEFTGVKCAVAVVNGTAALHASLLLAGVRPGDEVIIPTLTFVATANAVAYCSAVPHFADSNEATLGIDSEKLAEHLSTTAEIRGGSCISRHTGRPIRAVVPMHTFGHPVDLDPLVELCNRWNLVLVEDAAESLGSYYKGKHTGNFGRLAALSFNGNKVLTTGGGGAILTNDESLGKMAKHLTTTAKVPHRWEFFHDATGYNYRLPNINAALGCAQLEQLPRFLEQKRDLAILYRDAFQEVHGVRFFTEQPFATSNYWLNTLILAPPFAGARDDVLEMTNNNGIMTRPAWTPMHRLSMYCNCPRMDLSGAEDIERRLVNIPSSPELGVPHD